MATIDGVEVREVFKVERSSQHAHIRGLGLSPTLEPSQVGDGMAGQMQARRAAGVIVKMIKEGKISGRAILINGPVGSGKTAIAMGIAKELGEDTPFVSMNASEIFSKEVSCAEALVQGFRKAVAIKIKEETEVLEGEVVSIEIDRPASGSGPKIGKMTLKTTDMESVYELGTKMVDMCIKEQIQSGDVVQIDKANGRVTRLGRSFNRQHEYDAMGPQVKLVQEPQGEIQKHRETVHTVSLHDIDVINSRPKGYEALFTGDTGEISSEVREQINKKVGEWREEGKAAVLPGVLFIDESHMLTLRCFSFLNRLIEGEISPLLIMATNQKGIRTVRGSEHKAPMGIPRDFLDRSLVIKTRNYSYEEYRQIILLRAQEDQINVSYPISRIFTDIAYRCGLRYALQLIALADLKRSKDPEAKELTKKHISEVSALFSDVQRAQSGNLQRRKQFAEIRKQADLMSLKAQAEAKLKMLPGEKNAALRKSVLARVEKTVVEIKNSYASFFASIDSQSTSLKNRQVALAEQCKIDAVRCDHTSTSAPSQIIF